MEVRRFTDVAGSTTWSVAALIVAAACLLAFALTGCGGRQTAHVLKENQNDMVGSHTAGAETFKPLIDESVGKLLARQSPAIQQVSTGTAGPKRICFVGVENKSAEELGDFKDQIAEAIDNRIVASQAFQPISRRYVEAGLRACRIRPDELFLPVHQRQFQGVMEQQGQPFDYLLFATVTSGTTKNNGDYQRDYMLTLEMVDIHGGQPDKECATIRKGYHKHLLGKFTKY